MTPPPAALADLPDDALWSSRTWADFAAMPARRRAATPVLLPLFGFADWGLGRPLDLEEIIGSAVLREALRATAAAGGPDTVVLPPLRFVCAPYPHTLFGVDLPAALELVREIAAGVHAAGFSRLVLFNTSPWNEEAALIAAGDLRVDPGLHTFVIHLAALGLDLHPIRSTNRTCVQCAACACLGRLPQPDSPPGEIAHAGLRPGHVRQPPPLAFDHGLDEAVDAGRRIIAGAGAHAASLLAAIAAHRLPRSRAHRTSPGKAPPA
jgi:creatinine amidohydrolase